MHVKAPGLTLFLLLALSSLSAAPASALHSSGLAPLNPVMGPEVACLPVLFFAVVTEGIIVLVGARLRKKSTGRLLSACTLANCITVTALTVFTYLIGFIHLTTLGIIALVVAAETAIWLFEAVFMHRYPGTKISWKEALSFSLVMNLVSVAAGYGVVALLAGISAPA